MMRDTAIVAVILAFLVTPDQMALAQGRLGRGGVPIPFGPTPTRGTASISLLKLNS